MCWESANSAHTELSSGTTQSQRYLLDASITLISSWNYISKTRALSIVQSFEAASKPIWLSPGAMPSRHPKFNYRAVSQLPELPDALPVPIVIAVSWVCRTNSPGVLLTLNGPSLVSMRSKYT
jgi:hypothetical protein